MIGSMFLIFQQIHTKSEIKQLLNILVKMLFPFFIIKKDLSHPIPKNISTFALYANID